MLTVSVRKQACASLSGKIRIPPITVTATVSKERREISEDDTAFVQSLVLHMDRDIIVIDKPAGLAVHGGSATHWHLDGMLDALRFGGDERPRSSTGSTKTRAASWCWHVPRHPHVVWAKLSLAEMLERYTGRLQWGVPSKTNAVNLPLAKNMGKGANALASTKTRVKTRSPTFKCWSAGNRPTGCFMAVRANASVARIALHRLSNSRRR